MGEVRHIDSPEATLKHLNSVKCKTVGGASLDDDIALECLARSQGAGIASILDGAWAFALIAILSCKDETTVSRENSLYGLIA